MTEDELDLLASAYVDGEATQEEVALVERDPELQARVESFRAVVVDGSVSPPPGLAARHVAAALAEFEAVAAAPSIADRPADPIEGTGGADGGAAVVDLRAASAGRSRGQASSAPATSRAPRHQPGRTMPSWLPAAAGFVIIGGGLIWAIGQTGGSDDSDAGSDETAALAADEGEASTEAESAEGDDTTDDAAEGDNDTADLAGGATEESEAMEDSAADESARTAAGSAPAADGDDVAEEEEDAEAAFVEPEPKLFFDEIPDADTLADLGDLGDLPELDVDLDLSLCGPEIVAESLGDLIGFIPVLVEGEAAELYLFEDADGTEIRLLIDSDCQRLDP